MLGQGHQITFHAQHDGLRFRVAHAAIEFQGFDVAVWGNHQTGIQKAGVGVAFLGHAIDGRTDDFTHNFSVNLRRHHRRWGIGPHAACVRALVAVLQAFVVLAGGQGQNIFAIDHDDKAGFFAR